MNINLRDYYPFYDLDCLVDVQENDIEFFTNNMTKPIADVYVEFQRAENAYQRRKHYHKAYYSLDAFVEIENESSNCVPSPEDIFIEKATRDLLFDALDSLPEPQQHRIKMLFFDEMNISDIAILEGTEKSSVSECINLGLQCIKDQIVNIL